MTVADAPLPDALERRWALGLFVIALVFHGWGMTVGWQSKNLPGVEFRQAQTAISAYYIQRNNDFSLAYPTPVLGKPWSIPMEFPLYQWTTVFVSNATGLGLVKAGRLVSMACFYLTLPAIFLLLARWRVAPGRRWLVLALVASCPFYVFYGRAFLIETMALMFAIWFWVGLERAVAQRQAGWLAVALLAGVGAGLVKITTWMVYLLPVGVWMLGRLWQGRKDGRWLADLKWMAAALLPALVVAAWWVRKADAIKALNPLADFLDSVHMKDFNLGTTKLRLSPELWAMKWRIVRDEITWLPLFGLSLAGLLFGGGRHVKAAALCVALFLAPLVIFPVLYALHDYYYVANTLALLLAAGLAVVTLAENKRWRLAGPGLALVLVSGQIHRYWEHYYPAQAGVSAGGDRLSEALRNLTTPNDVVVIVGQDWNSMTAYYAGRRAMMLRADVEDDVNKLDRALANLSGETIGALVITGNRWQDKSRLIERLAARGLGHEPLLHGRGSWLFFRHDRLPQVIEAVRNGQAYEFAWAPGAAPKEEPLGGEWHETASLPPYRQGLFAAMSPQPVRFFTSFEPSVREFGGETSFSAHPVTQLVFQLGPGEHVLRGQVWFEPGAYNRPASEGQTDGVEVFLTARSSTTADRILGTRLVDPVNHPADRKPVPIEFRFTLPEAGEVELMFDPGTKGQDTRDWIWLRGPLVIQ